MRPFPLKSVGSLTLQPLQGSLESLADEMSAASSLKQKITYLGTANGIISPLLSPAPSNCSFNILPGK